ncbi:hypothetical protein [Kitasatospora sp. NPDC096140]|uniref:hypothetical protein n=1 Tax=Kitasatospora sp. NPDC096140 TaxID=3155425 RepID=UPI00332C7CAD
MSDSIPADLPAVEALRLARDAGAAARRPSPTPGWYGPAIAAGFTGVGTAEGAAVAADRVWLIGLISGAWAVVSGLGGWWAVRSGGVVQRRMAPGLGGPVVLTVLGVLAAASAGLALARWAGGDPLWIGLTAGAAAGSAFWAASRGLNRRVRRLREGH